MIFVIRRAWFAGRPWAQNAIKTNGFFMIFVIRWAWFAARPWAQTAVKTNGFLRFLAFDGLGLQEGLGRQLL